MSTNLISDEDWAIISSSSDFEDESTASSLIDPRGENSSSELSPRSNPPLSRNSQGNVTPGAAATGSSGANSENRDDPAADSVCTIRPVETKSEVPAPSPEVPLVEAETEQTTTCVAMAVDTRIRGLSRRLFAMIFSRCRQNLEATRAENVQSVCLARHAMFSLFSTMERHQDLLLYYFALALSATVLGFQYGPAVFVTLKEFTKNRVLRGFWLEPEPVPQSRLELLMSSARAWKSRWTSKNMAEKLSVGFPAVTLRTVGISPDVTFKLTEKFAKLRLEIIPVRDRLKNLVAGYANSIAVRVDGFGAFTDTLDGHIRGASRYITGTEEYLRSGAAGLQKWILSKNLQQIHLPAVSKVDWAWANDRIRTVSSRILNNLATCVQWTQMHFGSLLLDSKLRLASLRDGTLSLLSGVKTPVASAVEDLQQWTLAIEELGSSYFHLSRQILLRYFNRDAFMARYERYSSGSHCLTQHLTKSKEAFDSLSRKTYQLVWADNRVLRLLQAWARSLT